MSRPSAMGDAPTPDPAMVTYFLVNLLKPDRVKIGKSTALGLRMAKHRSTGREVGLDRDDLHLLGTLPGDFEAAWHDAYAADRLGTSEWFRLSEPLLADLRRLFDYGRSRRQRGSLSRRSGSGNWSIYYRDSTGRSRLETVGPDRAEAERLLADRIAAAGPNATRHLGPEVSPLPGLVAVRGETTAPPARPRRDPGPDAQGHEA